MYKSYVTVTHAPACIDSSSQLLSPTRRQVFHIQEIPHSSNTSKMQSGIALGCAGSAVEKTTTTTKATSGTVQTSPLLTSCRLRQL